MIISHICQNTLPGASHVPDMGMCFTVTIAAPPLKNVTLCLFFLF